MTAQLDKFTQSYIETALWSSTDENGDPLDGVFTVDDIAPETLAEMIADCKDFQDSFSQYLTGPNRLELAGHDFWLTRNRHGAGFWDGDWENGDFLTAMSHPYGEYNLYVGDDGLIHGQ